MVIPDKLMDFLNEARQPLPPINDADELLHLDSLAMMKLVAFLESDLGFTVADDQLVLANFREPARGRATARRPGRDHSLG